MTYCTDADLVKHRPNILQLGVEDWSNQRTEAYNHINRAIRTRWYRDAAPEMGYDPSVTIFDPDDVRSGQLTLLEVYKTLELAYRYLMKDSPEADGFERNSKHFRSLYGDELDLVLAEGIDYDWSGSGTFDDDEKYIRAPRRLSRA